MLQMSAVQLQQICDHAQHTYPEECCGLLLGRLNPSTERKELVEVWATRNAWNTEAAAAIASLTSDPPETPLQNEDSHSKADRYWIAPQDLLEAQRYGRDRQIDVIGIYHSHPDHPAVPSECDRAIDWVGYSYLIISVDQGRAIDSRAWSLDDQHQFQPEALIIFESSSSPTHSGSAFI